MAIGINKNLTKFEQKGVEMQENAYKVGYAKKCFAYSCKLCCEQNKRPCGTCASCPIKEAHIKALAGIKSNPRNKDFGTYKSKVKGEVKITLVVHY